LNRIAIKQTYSYKIIEISDIDFFRIEEGFVYIHAYDSKYLLDTPLINIEKKLDPKIFFRVHRKAIVNLSRIKAVYPWGRGMYRIELFSGELLDVSRNRSAEFREVIGMAV
jgi:two-component system LytT family response regulator